MHKMELTETDIQMIIESVLANVESALSENKQDVQQPVQMKTLTPAREISVSSNLEEHQGIFENVEQAIDAAYHAQLKLMNNFQMKDRDRMILAIREAI